MIFFCVAFLVGLALLIVSIATLNWGGVAIGGGIALAFGMYMWLTRDKHKWDFTS